MGRGVLLSQARQGVKMALGLIVVATFVRLVFGDPIDRRFIAGILGAAVVVFLCAVFLVPLFSPNITETPQLLWRWQRDKTRDGTGRDDADEDQL